MMTMSPGRNFWNERLFDIGEKGLAAVEEPPERADCDGDAALLQPLPQF
jgi:hypothetical protein